MGFFYHSEYLRSLTTIVFFCLATCLPFSHSLHAQCTLLCSNSVTVSLDTDGEATVYVPMLLQGSVGCSNNFNLTIVDTLGNQHGPLLDASLLGMPLVATVLHPASGNSCSAGIVLIDANPPVLDCVDTIFIWCNEPLDSLDAPTVSDNATETDSILLTHTDVFTDLDCFDTVDNQTVTAYIQRTWYATDESGNTDSCTQLIFLKRALLSQIVFPGHRDGVVLPALECGADDPYNLQVAGQPTVEGYPVNIAGSCELIVSHTDQQVPICGGARRIIRTWTVFDLCTNGFLVYAQIIRLEDHTPPAITCPQNVVFETFSSSCSAQVYLPQANALDACSGAVISPSWTYGTGYGPFNNVPAGVHSVTYAAQDGCANISTCEITVTVRDTKKPTALCETQVQASLEEDGTALIFAESFDNGSYDNCGIGQFLVKRAASGAYDTFVEFDCNDIGAALPITLLVIDANGLESTCNSSAVVRDQIAPEILCPGTANINCGTPYNNPSVTGQPYSTDNCGTATVTHTDQVNLNNCGNGTVTRTWRATDQSGNMNTCVQLIQIADNTTISVVFPKDTALYVCGPILDPSLMGEPIVTGQDCEQLQVTHTDYYFYTAQPSCFQLIRNWAVVDWCSYTPNNPNGGGFWAHTQVIEVRDSIAPALVCPASKTVGIEGAICSASVSIPAPTVDDCSAQLTVTNNSTFAQSNMGAANGIYPRGVHTITFTVSDGCGNTSFCNTVVTVIDSQAPTPVCNNGVSVTIQQTGFVTLTPANINNGSFDNCSPSNSLILQVSPNTFTCQDLGVKVVSLTVTDQAGNSAFCQTNVVVQDNFGICGNGIIGIIAGKLETETGNALNQKLIGLTGGITMAIQSDLDGTFKFPGLPLNKSYTLTPSYNTNPTNGVTTYDMVLIRRHILGIQALPSPYKIIAADVNKSKTVTTYDLVILQKLILNITTELPANNKSWRFVPTSFVFSNPSDPFQDNFPETVFIENLTANLFNQNFVGIKVGDVNDSANPSNLDDGGNEDRNFDKTLIFSTEDIELVAGQVMAIPFVAATSQPMAGFQFTIGFDEKTMSFQGFDQGALPSLGDNNFGTLRSSEGMVAMSWENTGDFAPQEGEVLFYLKFSVTGNARLSEVLTLHSRMVPAEAYLGGFEEMADPELAGVSLAFANAPIPEQADPPFFQNAPNPFYRHTNLHFFLPKPARATIRIFDVHGRLVKVFTGDFAEGQHTVPIELEATAPAGLLVGELEADGFLRQTIRMMVLDH